MAAACRALGAPGRVGQRLALQRDERPRDPPDAGRRRRRPRRGRPARAEGLEPGRRDLRRAASRGHARGLRVPGALRRGRRQPAPLDLDAEARLVAFLWRARPGVRRSSTTPRRAGSRSASPRRRSTPGAAPRVELADDPLELFGEVGGRAVVACAPGDVARRAARASGARSGESGRRRVRSWVESAPATSRRQR